MGAIVPGDAFVVAAKDDRKIKPLAQQYIPPNEQIEPVRQMNNPFL
jgi:hypothetical protein